MLSTDTEGKEDQADTPVRFSCRGMSSLILAEGHDQHCPCGQGLGVACRLHSCWWVTTVLAVVPLTAVVEQGTFPSYRCTETHEIAEERRLLYVAMTRAQTFLTMSFCQFRMMGGEESDKELSEFIKHAQNADPVSISGKKAKPCADMADQLFYRTSGCRLAGSPQRLDDARTPGARRK